tara:strand:- start:13593 stop:14096 length:504 start_codon:yes stop_codon:yes gene_type:complete
LEDKDKYLNFGECLGLISKSFGKPGERTFSMEIECNDNYIHLWLEKQQLALISQNIIKYKSFSPSVKNINSLYEKDEVKNYKLIDFALEYKESSNDFDFYFVGVDDQDKGIAATFSYQNKFAQSFANESLKIVSQGRPICSLCSNPINNDGHFCIKLNGHIENIKIV